MTVNPKYTLQSHRLLKTKQNRNYAVASQPRIWIWSEMGPSIDIFILISQVVLMCSQGSKTSPNTS